jgi:hypothetical protein
MKEDLTLASVSTHNQEDCLATMPEEQMVSVFNVHPE